MVDDCYDMAGRIGAVTGYNADYSPIINPASGYDEQNPIKTGAEVYQSILYNGATWPNVNKGTATVDITTPNNWGSGYFWLNILTMYRSHERWYHVNKLYDAVCRNIAGLC